MRRSPKGTYVRNTWDWLFRGGAVATAHTNTPVNGDYLVFTNLGMGSDYYDLYNVEVQCAPASPVALYVVQPIAPFANPVFGGFSNIDPAGTPPLAKWYEQGAPDVNIAYRIRENNVTFSQYTLELAAGPFARLYPGYGLGIATGLTTGVVLTSVSIFFQQIREIHG